MKCPSCGSGNGKVLDSRDARDGAAIRRRRECVDCGRRFTTFEEIERDEVRVIKRDGRREQFQRSKLERGVRAACAKRPVTDEQIRNLVDSVVEAIDAEEVQAEKIGELALERLLGLDQVAFVRFASVYRSFTGIDQFLSALEYVAQKQRQEGGREDRG